MVGWREYRKAKAEGVALKLQVLGFLFSLRLSELLLLTVLLFLNAKSDPVSSINTHCSDHYLGNNIMGLHSQFFFLNWFHSDTVSPASFVTV